MPSSDTPQFNASPQHPAHQVDGGEGRKGGASKGVLSDFENLRTERNQVLPGWGRAAQEKLKNARVLVIGCGGLGSPLLLGLAAAGVGTITLCEDDVLDASNLNRQVLYKAAEIGEEKAPLAAQRLQELSPELQVACVGRFTRDNGVMLAKNHDLVIDASDNFATRYLASDLCQQAGATLVWGSVLQYAGQLSVFPPEGPTLRDIYPEPPTNPPNNADAGVLGVAAHTIGSLMAFEAIKVLTGVGEPLVGRLMTVDGLTMRTRIFAIKH